MSPILVLMGVGVMAVIAAVALAVLVIGIHLGDRPHRRHLANAPQSVSEAFARRLLLGIRCPVSTPESAAHEKGAVE